MHAHYVSEGALPFFIERSNLNDIDLNITRHELDDTLGYALVYSVITDCAGHK